MKKVFWQNWAQGGEKVEKLSVFDQTRSLLMYFLEQSDGLFEDVLTEVIEEGKSGDIEEARFFYQGLGEIVDTSGQSQNARELVKELPLQLKELSSEDPKFLFKLCLGWGKLKNRENPEVAELVAEHPELTAFNISDLNEEEIEKIKKLCEQIGSEVREVCLEESNLGTEHISLLAFIKLAADNLNSHSETKTENTVAEEETVQENPAEQFKSSTAISKRWKELLEEIEKWPTSEDAWDEIEGFLDGVKMIAEEKKKVKQLLEKIENQIRTISSDNREMIEFFGFSAITEWVAENLEKEPAKEALDRLHELKEYFSSYSVLHKRKPENIVERRNLRQSMAELENKIGATFKKLEELLLNYDHDRSEIGEIGFRVQEEPAEKEKWEYVPRVNRASSKPSPEIKEGEIDTPPAEEKPEETSPPEEKKEKHSPKDYGEYRAVDKETETGEENKENTIKHQPIQDDQTEEEEVFNGKEKEGEVFSPPDDVSPQEEKTNPAQEAQNSRVALAVETDEVESEALSFGEKKLWEMISRKDLQGAYWVSRSLEQKGEDPIPANLIKILQASWWLPAGNYKVEKELVKLASSIRRAKGESAKVVGLAAALIPSVLAPRSGLQGWLFSPEDCPELAKLVENIQDFAEKGIGLKLEDMQNRPVQVARKERIKELSGEIEEKLNEKLIPSHISEQGQVILKNLLQEEGELYKLLDIAGKGKRRNLEKVEEMLEHWQGEQKVSQKISRVHAGLSSLAKKVLKDHEYREMVSFIFKLLEPVEQWCSEVHSYNRIVSGEERFDEMVQILQSVISISGPEAIKEVRGIRSKNEENVKLEGALNCLLWSLGVLLEIFGINHNVEFPNSEIDNQWWLVDTRNLDEAFGRRFFWVPEVTVDEEGYPVEEPGKSIIEPLNETQPGPQNLAEAAKKWLEKEDYRFIERILRVIEGQEGEEAVKAGYEEEKENLRQTLVKKISQTEETIDSALSNGFINEEQKKRFKKGITSIETDKVLNFNEAFGRINQVRQELDKVLEEQTDELQAKEAAWAWLQLRFRRQKGEGETRKYMETLFQFLGFLKIPEENSFQVISSQQEILHLRQRMSSSDPGRLFPQFASRTENEYDTVCFWEEPGADTLGDFIEKAKLDTQALIVIYFGRLSSDQKKELVEKSSGALQVAVLDESLILEELGKEDNALAELTLEYLALKKKGPGKKT